MEVDPEEVETDSGSELDVDCDVGFGNVNKVAYYERMDDDDESESSGTDSSEVVEGDEEVGAARRAMPPAPHWEPGRQRSESLREDEQFCEVEQPPTKASPPPGGHFGHRLPKVSDYWERRRGSSSEEEEEGNELWGGGGGRRNVHYPPERAPPIVDFLVIVTAFLVAVVAAYFSIS